MYNRLRWLRSRFQKYDLAKEVDCFTIELHNPLVMLKKRTDCDNIDNVIRTQNIYKVRNK